MKPAISGRTVVAGVVGAPVAHSLSPLIHNAWLAARDVDGVYVPFSPPPDRFAAFVDGLRGGVVRGLNVTIPFKIEALLVADRRTPRADAAGAANLLLFEADGAILADNTDGVGLFAAFAEQAPGFDLAAGPVAIVGAGGAARGAASLFLGAGAPQVRIVNRSRENARGLCEKLGPGAHAFGEEDPAALDGVTAVINATSLGLAGGEGPSLNGAPVSAVVMDMVYAPLRTEFLSRAQALGHPTVDGLAMLIGQARPSFSAFFGVEPPADVDVRALAVAALEAAR